MTREIKFRAWDKEHKVMFNHEANDWMKTGVETHDFLKIGLDGSVIRQMAHGDECFSLSDLQETATDKYELMQFTGLKDKNDTDIYENDFVMDVQTQKIFMVVFHEGSFMLSRNGTDLFHISDYSSDMLENIGNIHENPELLSQ